MKNTLSLILIFGALLSGIALAAHYWNPRSTLDLDNGNSMNASPTLIRLGDPKDSDLNGPGSSIENHPSGMRFYQREWMRGNLGAVEFVHGKHRFVIDNVLSVMGTADKDVPDGIYEWDISFGVSPEQADTHEAALTRVMKFLGQLRAAGWKRYIDVGKPRLQGRQAWLYASSFPVATYSLDSVYTPTQEEWNAILGHSPRWIFNAGDAYLSVSVMEGNMGGLVGKSTYLISADVMNEYEFYGVGYFSGHEDKIHNWKALLPAELNKYHAMRLKIEATLKAQGYTIDTTYQDPPVKALQASPASPQ
jgi:hypothetical protein